MKYITAEHDETYIFYFECNNSSAASYIIWKIPTKTTNIKLSINWEQCTHTHMQK